MIKKQNKYTITINKIKSPLFKYPIILATKIKKQLSIPASLSSMIWIDSNGKTEYNRPIYFLT
jgi:hypothetical protein